VPAGAQKLTPEKIQELGDIPSAFKAVEAAKGSP
jgi:hypothetical protein